MHLCYMTTILYAWFSFAGLFGVLLGAWSQTAPCTSRDPQVIGDESNIRNYYVCTNGEPENKTCGFPKLMYNPYTELCDYYFTVVKIQTEEAAAAAAIEAPGN